MASHVSRAVWTVPFPGLAAPCGSRLQRDTLMRGCSSLWGRSPTGFSYREPEAKSLLLSFPLGDPESWPTGLATVLQEEIPRKAASKGTGLLRVAWEEPRLGQGKGCRAPACADRGDWVCKCQACAGLPGAPRSAGSPTVSSRSRRRAWRSAEDAAGWGWREWYGTVGHHGRPGHCCKV